jgi:Dolichyl-phosphate-mannose-protein mannosyltransferase
LPGNFFSYKSRSGPEYRPFGAGKLAIQGIAAAGAAGVTDFDQARTEDDTRIYALIACFGASWWLFDAMSLGSVGVHFDVSEMSVWAQHFAWGYKHPPLTGWIFGLWFSVFPRVDWAAHLLAASTVTSALCISWRLLRDHLEYERAVVGICSLTLIPLYTFLATKFNANVVLMPFWAAALLFYLRARRTLGVADAILAGAFAGLSFLGKYWAIYLVAGMGAASFVGPNLSGFWRSKAPYAMAFAAALVVAPHLYWLVTNRTSDTDDFLTRMLTERTFAAVARNVFDFLTGSVAYIVVPLAFLVSLLPSRAAILDTVLPANPERRMAVVLLIVPLLVPIVADIIVPHRLTCLWTFPNWALLPVVLYGSPLLAIRRGVAGRRSAIVTILVTMGALIAAPIIGVQHLSDAGYLDRQHWQEIAEGTQALSPQSIRFVVGTPDVTVGLPFYLPHVEASGAIRDRSALAIVCRGDDTNCQTMGDAMAPGKEWTSLALARGFLGFSGPAAFYRVKVVRK